MNEICHIEIPALDVQRAAKFYKDLFAWKMTTWEGSEDYILFDPEKEPGGGIMKADKIEQGSMIWYVHVTDIPLTLRRVDEFGGRTVQEKTEIPGVGFWGSFHDTEGNLVGLFSKE